MPVGRLLHEMSSAEISEWMIYDRLEPLRPLDEGRMDQRFAALASLIANMHRNGKKRRKPFAPKDFMYLFGSPTPLTPGPSPKNGGGEGEPKRKPWQDMLAMVEMWNAALGGDDRRPPQ